MSFIEFDNFTVFHDAYAASIGRALVVCQHIEDCAHHVMVTYVVTDRIREGEDDLERIRSVASGLRNCGLGKSAQRLSAADEFSERAAALEIGRQARNWLVHEAGALLHAGYGMSTFVQSVRERRSRIDELCEADRLLSVASYEICEREPAGFRSDGYSTRLQDWIFAPIINAFGSVHEHQVLRLVSDPIGRTSLPVFVDGRRAQSMRTINEDSHDSPASNTHRCCQAI